MKKRILSMLLVVALIFCAIPITAIADTPGYAYISISYEGQFLNDKDGEPLAYVPVSLEELASINLEDYGLSEYLYDADGDGTYEITALHLCIYIHTVRMGLNWDDVVFEGSPGSSYFAGGLFGFDENLRYDLNGEYPVDEALSESWGYTVGATSERIVLSDGDFLDLASFSCWNFYTDDLTGFRYFADENGAITHAYVTEPDVATQVKLIRTYSSWAGAGVADEAYFTVYYGTEMGTAIGTVETDDSGCANITFPSAGTWYVWSDGGRGTEDLHYGCDNGGETCFVSSPAYAKVTVESAGPSADEIAANEVISKIDDIGTVSLDSETAITEAREAYDALSEAQKELVTNYSELTAAETELARLKQIAADEDAANKAAADEVEEKIAAIGTVNIFSGSKIDEADEAFDALTDEQKDLVDNKTVLDAAKERLAVLYEDAADADHRAIYNATGNYIQGLGTPGVGSTGGEWMVIDLTRAGNACPEGYYDNVVKFVNENINEKEQLHRAKSTENSRIILGLTSAGYDVTNVDGHNLLFGLTDMNYLKRQGINGPIWALIAFDCYDYEIPTNADAADQVTREKIINHILASQHNDGGWSLQANVTLPSDPDITGMAIQALAPYYNTNSKVKAAVDEALVMLSETQSNIGGFGSIDGACTESCAQVIVALTALGIDPETDSRFIKNGISVMDALCMFAVEGGGFEHVPNGGRNGMATEQGQYALASYFRFKNDQTSLYDMTDVTVRKVAPAEDDGMIKNTTDGNKNACSATLDVTDKSLGNAILTEEEKALVDQGADVNVSLSVKDVSESVSKEDKALVEKAMEDKVLSDAKVGMYLDITLTKQVGDAAPVVVTETNGEVKISILVPDELINTDTNVERTYKVIRIHEGKTDVLDAEFDVKTGKLTFKTDAFSTYTLVYTDTVADAEEEIANTNDDTNIGMPVMGMSFGLFGMIAVACLARKKEF